MEDRKQSWRCAVNQILAALCVCSLYFHVGVVMAFATVFLPPEMLVDTNETNFDSENETANNYDQNITDISQTVDKDEASWIASLVELACAAGAAVAGITMERWGRKLTCLAAAAINIVGWGVTIGVQENVILMYVARILTGFAEGLSVAAYVYTSEVAHSSIRSMLLLSTSVFISLGIVVTTVLGYYLTWRGVAVFSLVFSIINVLTLIFIPETPNWVFNNVKNEEKKNKKLAKSLKWLYKDPKVFEEQSKRFRNEIELKTIDGNFDHSKNEVEDNDENQKKLNNLPSEAEKEEKLFKPVMLLGILFLLQQLAGPYVILFFAIQVFEASGSVNVNAWLCLIILGIIRLVMAILSSFQYFGRRTLLLWSSTGMAASMFFACYWLHFHEPALTPVICILIYVTFSSFGVTVLPWTLVSELLPSKHRGSWAGYINGYADTLMFFALKLCIPVQEAIGMANVFLVFGVSAVLIFVFVRFMLPETLGKTLDEIQDAM